MGFNPIYKRVVVDLIHPKLGKLKIAKGLATKVVDTADGGVDDAEEQWTVDKMDLIKPMVKDKDKELSSKGYKTLGVAIKINEKPWTFCGILPMMDPPRDDSAKTIMDLKFAGIKTKMITGDHLNIAIETARQIGIGPAIYPGEDVRQGSETAKQNILAADGFAQVLPSDKREVVEVLKNYHGLVVGMTGDGVNDAPALSAAQVGVAVDDATDAAMNAAAILLRAPGLSAIYSGVVESRRIFRKLKAYVTYRFAASIQIVLCLAVLVLASNCSINPTYIILLALFNDITMLPIAYDYQEASTTPENPDVYKILFMSTCFGFMETFFTLMFAYGIGGSNLSKSDLDLTYCADPTQANPDDDNSLSKAIQGAIWLQMFVASELLIFSARAPSYFNLSLAPSPSLVFSVLMGCILASIVSCNMMYFGGLYAIDIVLIWVYNILCLILIDRVKVGLLLFLNENPETLPDEVYVPPVREEEEDEDILATNLGVPDEMRMSLNQSAAAFRMTKAAPGGSERLSQMDMGQRASRASSVGNRQDGSGRLSISSRAGVVGNTSDLRGSFVTSGGNLRPNTPASRKAGR
jgi:H+-transporting ATPase